MYECTNEWNIFQHLNIFENERLIAKDFISIWKAVFLMCIKK